MDPGVADQGRQGPQRGGERRLGARRRRWRRRRRRRCGRRGRSSSSASARGGGQDLELLALGAAAGGQRLGDEVGEGRGEAERERGPRVAARRPPAPPRSASAAAVAKPELAVVGGAGEAAHRDVERGGLGAGDRRVDGGVDRLRLARANPPSSDDMSRRLGAIVALLGGADRAGDRRLRLRRRFPAWPGRAASASSPPSAVGLVRAAAPRRRRGCGDRVAALLLGLGDRRSPSRATTGWSWPGVRGRLRRSGSPAPASPSARTARCRAAPPPSHPVLFVNPLLGRRAGGQGRPGRGGARSAASRRSSCGRARTWRSSCARRWGGAPTAWRWPAATARRRWSRRSPPSTTFPTPASRRGPATTSPSTWASTAKTSSAPSTPSSTGASVM